MAWRHRATHWNLGITIGFLLLACVFAIGPDSVWTLMMMRAFGIPLLWGLVAVTIVLIVHKHWLPSTGAMITAAAVWHLSLAARPAPASPSLGLTGLKLVQMNVLQTNTDQVGTIKAVLAQNPDVICFQEVDQGWADGLLQALGADFPYHCMALRNDLYGMALFSRTPLERDTVRMLGPLPCIAARVQCGSQIVQLMAIRLLAPESPNDLRERNAQWRQLALWAQEDTLPTMVLGDLNTVPWDDAFKLYISVTGMHDITSNAPTWPAFRGYALVPLDHILLSKKLGATGYSTFTIPGSDHLGVSTCIGLVGK